MLVDKNQSQISQERRNDIRIGPVQVLGNKKGSYSRVGMVRLSFLFCFTGVDELFIVFLIEFVDMR